MSQEGHFLSNTGGQGIPSFILTSNQIFLSIYNLYGQLKRNFTMNFMKGQLITN